MRVKGAIVASHHVWLGHVMFLFYSTRMYSLDYWPPFKKKSNQITFAQYGHNLFLITFIHNTETAGSWKADTTLRSFWHPKSIFLHSIANRLKMESEFEYTNNNGFHMDSSEIAKCVRHQHSNFILMFQRHTNEQWWRVTLRKSQWQ